MAVFITLIVLVFSVLLSGQTPAKALHTTSPKVISNNTNANSQNSKLTIGSNGAKIEATSVQANSNADSSVSNSEHETLAEDQSEIEPTLFPLMTPKSPSPTPTISLWNPSPTVPVREPTPTKIFETITPGPTPITLPIKPVCPPGVTRADANCLDSN